VSPKTSDVLRPGISTKEEVLLTLGEPDFVSEDGQRFGFAWTKVKALWFVGGYGSGATGEAERSYLLEVSFDKSNRVTQARLLKEWGPAVSPNRELNVQP
jgi:outer membrane protein assembly factor BamE (lipoprotein component of BamABCDE complex)